MDDKQLRHWPAAYPRRPRRLVPGHTNPLGRPGRNIFSMASRPLAFSVLSIRAPGIPLSQAVVATKSGTFAARAANATTFSTPAIGFRAAATRSAAVGHRK